MRRTSVGILALFVAALPAVADILPPESKWITHVVRFEKLSAHPGYVFYVYPRDLSRSRPGNSSVRVPESGEVAISGLNPLATRKDVFLFAIPNDLHGPLEKAPREEWFEEKVKGVLKGGPLVEPTRTIARSDKRNQITTTYTVTIEKGELRLTEEKSKPEPEAKPGQQPNFEVGAATLEPGRESRLPWLMGGGATGAALVCAAWLAFRKKI